MSSTRHTAAPISSRWITTRDAPARPTTKPQRRVSPASASTLACRRWSVAAPASAATTATTESAPRAPVPSAAASGMSRPVRPATIWCGRRPTRRQAAADCEPAAPATSPISSPSAQPPRTMAPMSDASHRSPRRTRGTLDVVAADEPRRQRPGEALAGHA